MFVIGLTGGIASGKSTVSQLLAERGVPVIDADQLGHESYLPGTDAFRRIVDAFGEGIIDTTGHIDRRALGGLVFGNPEAMGRLTRIVWPAIHDLAKRRLQELRDRGIDVALLEAAVLVEADWSDLVDETWVVVASPEIAAQRLMQRNHLTDEEAASRLRSQISNEERTRHADLIIENNDSLASLRAQVDEHWNKLQKRLEQAQQLRA